jgi:basic membrane protein A
MRKKIFLTIILALMLTCCTKDGETIYQINPDEEKPSTAPLVTVIYGPNGLGDRSYNDLIYKGVETAAKKYGLRTLQLSPETEEQGLAYLETMFRQMESATDTVRRLFVTPSPVYDAYIRKNNKRLEKNPNADLLYMETTTPLDGKGSTLYIDYYGAMYMGGCLVHYSAENRYSYGDLVTLLLANPYTQSVVEAGEGFLAGFNDPLPVRTPLLSLHVRYLSNEAVGGFTTSDTTAYRIYREECNYEDEYLDGSNLVTFVPICGGAMHPFFRVVRSSFWAKDTYVGIDADTTDDDNFCLFSILKHIDKVMIDYVGLWLNGSLPKHQTLGLADKATDVIIGQYRYGVERMLWMNEGPNLDSLRQVAIRKEKARYEK